MFQESAADTKEVPPRGLDSEKGEVKEASLSTPGSSRVSLQFERIAAKIKGRVQSETFDDVLPDKGISSAKNILEVGFNEKMTSSILTLNPSASVTVLGKDTGKFKKLVRFVKDFDSLGTFRGEYDLVIINESSSESPFTSFTKVSRFCGSDTVFIWGSASTPWGSLRLRSFQNFLVGKGYLSPHGTLWRPRVGMATLCVGKDYTVAVAPGIQSKREYCSANGYDFIFDDGKGVKITSPSGEVHEMPTSFLDATRPIPWSKIKLVKGVLPGYDFIFWSDADVLIMNPRVRLEELLRLLPDDKNLLLAKDALGVINTGNFFLRNILWSFRLLEEIYAQKHCINHGWWEQKAFIELYERTLDKPGANEIKKDISGKPLVYNMPDVSQRTELLENHRLFNAFVGVKDHFRDGDFLLHFAGKGGEVKRLMTDYSGQKLKWIPEVQKTGPLGLGAHEVKWTVYEGEESSGGAWIQQKKGYFRFHGNMLRGEGGDGFLETLTDGTMLANWNGNDCIFTPVSKTEIHIKRLSDSRLFYAKTG